MSYLASLLFGGLLVAASVITPVPANPTPVRVSIELRYAQRPDEPAKVMTTQVQFDSMKKASAVCADQSNMAKLAMHMQKKSAYLGDKAIFGATCVSPAGLARLAPPKAPAKAPLSPKVLAALRANNTVQRVTLELHFLTADGRPKVITNQAQGFSPGDADKFCASDLTAASKGIARYLTITNRAFAAMTYVSANCATDRSGSIRVSTQTHPIEGN